MDIVPHVAQGYLGLTGKREAMSSVLCIVALREKCVALQCWRKM